MGNRLSDADQYGLVDEGEVLFDINMKEVHRVSKEG